MSRSASPIWSPPPSCSRLSSAASKWLVATYPVGEVLFTRTLVALIACALFILPRTGFAVFRTQRLSHHVMRWGLAGLLADVPAHRLQPDVAGRRHRDQFLLAAVRHIVQRCCSRRRRPGALGALLVGFCGVLIVTNPGADRSRSARCSRSRTR